MIFFLQLDPKRTFIAAMTVFAFSWCASSVKRARTPGHSASAITASGFLKSIANACSAASNAVRTLAASAVRVWACTSSRKSCTATAARFHTRAKSTRAPRFGCICRRTRCMPSTRRSPRRRRERTFRGDSWGAICRPSPPAAAG